MPDTLWSLLLPYPLATTHLPPVSTDLPIPDILYKWNHMIDSLL